MPQTLSSRLSKDKPLKDRIVSTERTSRFLINLDVTLDLLTKSKRTCGIQIYSVIIVLLNNSMHINGLFIKKSFFFMMIKLYFINVMNVKCYVGGQVRVAKSCNNKHVLNWKYCKARCR